MAKASRPAAITKLSDAPRTGMKNWIIYGNSGIGKTVFAGTAPNAIFLTVEAAGTESAKEFGSTADEWVTESWADIQAAYKWLSEGGCKEYEWLIIDSLSEMEEACWRDQLDTMAAGNSGRSIYAAQLQDYNIIGNKIKRLVDKINRLPINVIYTALPMQVDIVDPITEEETTLVMPSLGSPKNGKLAQKISAQMTLTGMLTVQQIRVAAEGDEGPKKRKEVRRLHLAGNAHYVAKTRHHSLGRSIDSPTVPDMIETINGATSKDSE